MDEKYYDAEGNPTCACNFNTGEVCEFYTTQRFGLNETCNFAPDSYNGLTVTMKRRDSPEGNELGSLIPGAWCPLFKYEEDGQL